MQRFEEIRKTHDAELNNKDIGVVPLEVHY